tara:strand:- start:22 stop:234 length:213 start_codon:yes stop_codon:yes gene_type:complete
MIDDDGYETVHVFPKPEKKDFFVEIEGVIKKTYPVKADGNAKAVEMARREFVIEFGGDKEKLLINDVWKK